MNVNYLPLKYPQNQYNEVWVDRMDASTANPVRNVSLKYQRKIYCLWTTYHFIGRLGRPHRSWKFCSRAQAVGSIFKPEVTVFCFYNCWPFSHTSSAPVTVAVLSDEKIRTNLASRVAHLLALSPSIRREDERAWEQGWVRAALRFNRIAGFVTVTS